MQDDAQLEECFSLFDANRDNLLTEQEFAVCVRMLGVVQTSAAITETVQRHAAGGGIGIGAFREGLEELRQVSLSPKEIKEAMGVLDKQHKGLVPAAEFRRVLTTMGDPLTHKEVTDLFASMGTDEQGVVGSEEFCQGLFAVVAPHEL